MFNAIITGFEQKGKEKKICSSLALYNISEGQPGPSKPRQHYPF